MMMMMMHVFCEIVMGTSASIFFRKNKSCESKLVNLVNKRLFCLFYFHKSKSFQLVENDVYINCLLAKSHPTSF